MDNQARVKIKVGEHTFEAEGSPEDVKEQYRLFVDLIGSMPQAPQPIPQTPSPQEPVYIQTLPPPTTVTVNEGALDKIMNVDGRIVSLTVRPKSLQEAILLLLLGHKALRASEYTTGAEIIDGLKTTGGLTFSRIDKLMEKISDDGDIIINGERRGKKYRMTCLLYTSRCV